MLCRLLFLLLYEILKIILLAIFLDNEGLAYACISWYFILIMIAYLSTPKGYQPYKPKARWKKKLQINTRHQWYKGQPMLDKVGDWMCNLLPRWNQGKSRRRKRYSSPMSSSELTTR